MATLTGYVSAVAAAARQMAGAEGVAVAARQEGVVEEKAAVAEREVPKEDEAVDRATKSMAVEETSAKRGPDSLEHASVPELIRPLRKPDHKPGQTIKTEAVVQRAEPQVVGVKAAAERREETEPLRAVPQPREELIGSDVGRRSGPKSVEVVLHAADDLTAVIAESDDVREAILRTVAEVMRER